MIAMVSVLVVSGQRVEADPAAWVAVVSATAASVVAVASVVVAVASVVVAEPAVLRAPAVELAADDSAALFPVALNDLPMALATALNE